MHGLCYAQVNEEDILADFSVRKAAFINQQKQTTVLLWMVVAITLSGVILAGVQLIASYRLAFAGKTGIEIASDLNIEKTRLSVKSSVTGVVILSISLAFFYIFVHEVYLIREQNVVVHPQVNSIAGTPDLTADWSNTIPVPATSDNASISKGPHSIPVTGGGVGPAPATGKKAISTRELVHTQSVQAPPQPNELARR